MPTVNSVLLCSDYLPPSGGGVEVVVKTLAERLAAEGVDVGIFTFQANQISIRENDDITVYESKTIELTDIIGLQSQVSPAAVAEFRSVVRKHDPDVVHAHNRFFFTSLVAAGWTALGFSDIALVTTLHLGAVEDINGISGLAARMYELSVAKLIFRATDRFVAVSNAVADHGASLGAHDVTVVPNGVDPEEFYPGDSDGPPVILFVGRLIQNKGIDTFIRCLPAVLEDHPNARVRIIGTGPMRSDLEQLIKKFDLTDCIEFCGFVESVAEEMRRADIFCRPSLSEGMPLTLLEAMASGLPVVVTPVAGVPEVVTHNQNGILVPKNDPASLSMALSDVLDDEEWCQELSIAAREEVVNKYSWQSRTEQILDVYQDATSME